MKCWRWPTLLAALTVVGLLSALLGGGGAFWFVSWIALSIPLLAIALAVLRSLVPRRR
jgi:hypothetical protein